MEIVFFIYQNAKPWLPLRVSEWLLLAAYAVHVHVAGQSMWYDHRVYPPFFPSRFFVLSYRVVVVVVAAGWSGYRCYGIELELFHLTQGRDSRIEPKEKRNKFAIVSILRRLRRVCVCIVRTGALSRFAMHKCFNFSFGSYHIDTKNYYFPVDVSVKLNKKMERKKERMKETHKFWNQITTI